MAGKSRLTPPATEPVDDERTRCLTLLQEPEQDSPAT